MLRLLTLTSMTTALFCAALLLATDEWQTRKTALSEWWQATERGARLHAEQVAVSQSVEAMNAVVRELIEGRMSLREAAQAMFAELEKRLPDLDHFWKHYPARSREESILLWTINLTSASLDGDPRRYEVLRRLQAELHDCLGTSDDPSPDAIFPMDG